MQTNDEYDEKAVEWIAALETRLDRLRLDRFGAFAAVLNALEYQLEDGDADPSVVRHLGEALLALAAVHRVPLPALKDITQTLGLLHGHVVARAHASAHAR
jgi:hypothetical protein